MAEFTLTGRHGRELFVRVWESPQTPRAVIILAHGFGEHSGRYEHVASRLTGAGYLVVAPDHHGHGHSAGPRARVDFADAVADLDQVVDSQVRIHPHLPVIMLGHSMGGGIALRYAIAHQQRLRGLILSAPLVRLDVNPALKVIGRLTARVAPGAPVAQLDAGLVSRDPAVVSAYIADPLVHHGSIPAATAAGWVRHGGSIMADAGRITVPTLLLWGTADGLCPPAGAEQLARALSATDLTTRSFDGLYHEIFNEPEREAVLNEVVAWLAAHC